MSSGQKIAEGHPDAVLADENVRRVYLGGAGNDQTGEPTRIEATGTPILSVSHLTVRYGKAQALSDVSLAVVDKGVTAVVGLNGAARPRCSTPSPALSVPKARSALPASHSGGARRMRSRARASCSARKRVSSLAT